MSSYIGIQKSSIRVSVIVPVFNPGPSFRDLIASLDRQSLRPDQFEILLCDDGSDEATQQRLVRIAEDRPHVRILNLPHSGWPGTPRNAGVEAAQGTYVQFVDQDDYLFDTALEALCDYADAHGSDVVVGREVGVGRPLPTRIWRRDIPDAKLGEDPLLEMLTPHKLFRTAFLRDNGIRFPDGRVRLEDHLYVMQAYFAASTISILASTPCYAWVKQAGSASSSRIDPESYYPHLEAVLDIVERNTDPGALRDRLLRHWLRGKVLKRLAGKRMLRYPAEYRARLIDTVTPLVERRFGPGVDRGLAFPGRIRVALLRAGLRDDLVRFAEFESALDCTTSITKAAWSRGGGLHLDLEVRVTRDDRDALVFDPESGRLSSLPLESANELPPEALVAGKELGNDSIEVFLAGERPDDDRRLTTAKLDHRGRAKIAIDPLRVFGGESGTLRLTAKVRKAGWTFEVPVVADASTLGAAGSSPFLAGSPVSLETGGGGGVELRRSSGGRVRDLAGRAARKARAARRG